MDCSGNALRSRRGERSPAWTSLVSSSRAQVLGCFSSANHVRATCATVMKLIRRASASRSSSAAARRAARSTGLVIFLEWGAELSCARPSCEKSKSKRYYQWPLAKITPPHLASKVSRVSRLDDNRTTVFRFSLPRAHLTFVQLPLYSSQFCSTFTGPYQFQWRLRRIVN